MTKTYIYEVSIDNRRNIDGRETTPTVTVVLKSYDPEVVKLFHVNRLKDIAVHFMSKQQSILEDNHDSRELDTTIGIVRPAVTR